MLRDYRKPVRLYLRTPVALQGEGIIRYSRGRIELLDGKRLERSTCECYRIMESQYERIALPQTSPAPVPADIESAVNLTEMANLYIEQLGSAIKNVRRLCAQNDAVYRRQEEILSNRRQ